MWSFTNAALPGLSSSQKEGRERRRRPEQSVRGGSEEVSLGGPPGGPGAVRVVSQLPDHSPEEGLPHDPGRGEGRERGAASARWVLDTNPRT
jgi:hypothetical protein